MKCEKCGQQIKSRKSRDLEEYYHSHLVPLVAEHQGMTHAEAHRFLLELYAERDRFGRPIRTSDGDFSRDRQVRFVEIVRNGMARDMDLQTDDPDPEWKSK